MFLFLFIWTIPRVNLIKINVAIGVAFANVQWSFGPNTTKAPIAHPNNTSKVFLFMQLSNHIPQLTQKP